MSMAGRPAVDAIYVPISCSLRIIVVSGVYLFI